MSACVSVRKNQEWSITKDVEQTGEADKYRINRHRGKRKRKEHRGGGDKKKLSKE